MIRAPVARELDGHVHEWVLLRYTAVLVQREHVQKVMLIQEMAGSGPNEDAPHVPVFYASKGDGAPSRHKLAVVGVVLDVADGVGVGRCRVFAERWGGRGVVVGGVTGRVVEVVCCGTEGVYLEFVDDVVWHYQDVSPTVLLTSRKHASPKSQKLQLKATYILPTANPGSNSPRFPPDCAGSEQSSYNLAPSVSLG